MGAKLTEKIPKGLKTIGYNKAMTVI